jgi:uncharacterized protein
MTRDRNEGQLEQGIEIPHEQLDPETLRRLIQEFVSRDGADWGETGGTLDDKVEQVLQQLRVHKVKVVYDLSSQTANLISCQSG